MASVLSPVPAMEAYLQMRAELKESIRKQRRLPPADGTPSFGSFFGPSELVVARRVVQEFASLRKSAEQISKAAGPPAASDPSVGRQSKTRAEALRENRDYSFLFSDDNDGGARDGSKKPAVAAPATRCVEPEPRTTSSRAVAPAVAASSQVFRGAADKKKLPVPAATSGSSSSSSSIRGAAASAKKHPLPAATSRPSSSSSGTSVNGAAAGAKKPHLPATTTTTSSSSSSATTTSVRAAAAAAAKRPPIPATSTKPKLSNPPGNASGSGFARKRKQASTCSDDENDKAISIIRKMFRYKSYDPMTYADDSDDSDMEVGFDEIMREERRSSVLGSMEDKEQLLELNEKVERLQKSKNKIRRPAAKKISKFWF